jgi:hypothetical protein
MDILVKLFGSGDLIFLEWTIKMTFVASPLIARGIEEKE